ncbi:Cysteine-rich receptor-like protein kinase 10 [Morella rubra]|uniref:non-specific serine/threonine protein kinase n=1 Tax=Morella rubra TaxID=262757 RepID=A0A6A1WDX7_9ROSI|nr:Cysteine-rich receptor-like protein kinase 10 [Morella rubra]
MDTEKMLKCLMLVVLFFFPSCTSIDTLTANQSIKDGQSLMSKEKNFALGFFSPGNSSRRYLGIWFVEVREQTAVWIANRNDPINGSSGVLSINKYGNLILYDSNNRPVWSTDVPVQGTTSSVAHLLDSGNLVLVHESNNKLLWQSFDYPTDTLLPGMKLGLNRRTGLDRYLTSSKSQEDPGVGDYSYKLNPTGSPQFFLYNGSTPYYCSWPWPWRSSAAKTPADYMKRKLHDQSFNVTSTKGSLDGDELKYSSRHPDSVVFDLSSMVAATENFSPGNKFGQGGFGSVFKGQLSNGQPIAVKRLSKCSLQGIEEFKNEVMLIAKLQHRNLVKNHTRRSSLNWVQRFVIILGIARGILYLHQDSRLRIIHRDLKTSVLLDAEMNPKISDFGMIRMFKGDQIQDRTTRVVGTYGYMSPEYAVFGRFSSTKSDVFSFGVVVLEIIAGKKNNVLELWKEDRALEIADPSVKETYVPDEVLRCIHIALLRVEEDAGDRPIIMAVLLVLSSEATTLPSPKQPAFIFGRPLNESDSGVGRPSYSVNQVTNHELSSTLKVCRFNCFYMNL